MPSRRQRPGCEERDVHAVERRLAHGPHGHVPVAEAQHRAVRSLAGQQAQLANRKRALTQHAQHSGVKLDYFDQDLQLKLKEQGATVVVLPPSQSAWTGRIPGRRI